MSKNKNLNIKLINDNEEEVNIEVKATSIYRILALIFIVSSLSNLVKGLSYGSMYSIVDGGSSLIVGLAVFNLAKYRIRDLNKLRNYCHNLNYRAANEYSAEILKQFGLLKK